MRKTDRRSREPRKKRQRKKIVLIVTEGQKTEVLYFNRFNDLAQDYHVRVITGKWKDPVHLMEEMIKRLRQEELRFESGDSAWCVFDVDQTNDERLRHAKQLAADHNIGFIVSNPCFEIWYLLHYGYTTKKFASSAEVEGDLKKHLQHYGKNMDVYDDLQDLQPTAVANAERLNAHHQELNQDICLRAGHPSTQVFKLVQHLVDLHTPAT